MNILSFIAGILFFSTQTDSPNFIGMHKDEIKKVMTKTNPGFEFDEGAKNATYKYLKFVDKYNEETWLFFLSDKDICTFSKLMSDYSNLEIRKKELDKKYKKAGESKWIFVEKGQAYVVELKKDEWYFTIVTKVNK